MPTLPRRPASEAWLFYADSERHADVLYLSGLFVPDPFLLCVHRGRRIGVLSRLEISRAQKESSLDEIIPLEALLEEAREAAGSEHPGPAPLAALLARKLGIQRFLVPVDFPAGIAFALKDDGLEVVVRDDLVAPLRLKKTEAQAKAIAQGNRASATGIRAAERALKASEIRGHKLYLEGKVLTSERLRTLIDTAVLQAGARASHTICAGGAQACDPHCAGHGPLRPHELIIVDVFPRVDASGYHGDMTRTFLKGTPTEAQQRLVETVRKAQLAALEEVRAGIDASRVHRAASHTFEKHGYLTEQRNGQWTGFFHSTGHGLGLEVHEAPRVSVRKGKRLASGMVFTVEPGLYYPDIGGCRIEDVVRVTPEGCEMLSKAPYRWHLR